MKIKAGDPRLFMEENFKVILSSGQQQELRKWGNWMIDGKMKFWLGLGGRQVAVLW